MTHLDQAILEAVRAGASRRTEVLEALADRGIACTLPRFYQAIKRLLADGRIRRQGARRGTTYVAFEEDRDAA